MSEGTAAMEEGRRQSYLAALGIPLWSSRHDLPGALPSAGLEFCPWVDEGVSVQTVAAPLQAAVPVVEPPSRPAVAESAPVVQKPPLTPEAPAEPAATARPAASADHPRFSCRVQQLTPDLSVVIALDDVPDLSAQEYRLLENLMLALGGDLSADPRREHFRWPLSPNPAIPRDAAAAREALAAFLARRRDAQRWLVLGETLAVYVRTALPGHSVMAAPALRELLENPRAKRALWQALHG